MLEKAVTERAYVEINGKPAPGYHYVTASDAEAALSLRRKEVHSRFLNMWARRIMVTPEQALVPLKERDALLASKFEVSGDGKGLGCLRVSGKSIAFWQWFQL
jgi:hypothetical protein